MEELNFLIELRDRLTEREQIPCENFESYYLLHQYCAKFIIPMLVTQRVTISVVELTTCGLLTDLLTGVSGSSSYFLLGITPYSSDMKLKLGISRNLLKHDGPGTVSTPTAIALAQKVRIHSNSTIGLAETGMLPSDLKGRRTIKKAGEIHLAIDTATVTVNKKLCIQSDLPRVIMRQIIAFEVLKTLESFLSNGDLPKSKDL